VKNPRLLLAVLGVCLGVAGAVLALAWSAAAAVMAACGAMVAAGAVLLPDAGRGRGDVADVDHERTIEPPAPAAAPDGVQVVTVAGADPDAGTTAVPVSASSSVNGTPTLTDPETGLFSQDYFDVAIDARIAAARRHLRPVGVVMLEVVEGLRTGKTYPADAKRVAEAIQETLREADTACRRSDGRFALLLEDTPENGAIWTVERIRRYLSERDGSLTLWAGVACYPAHGFSSEVLLRLAGAALDAAREWRQDRIEVAVGE
jgi:diguanylate cyclase (GGDEF)-like protein